MKENILSSLMFADGERIKDIGANDMVAYLPLKHKLEKDTRVTSGNPPCVAIAETGEGLLLVPDVLLKSSPNEKIPSDDKEYSNNEDDVIILRHTI